MRVRVVIYHLTVCVWLGGIPGISAQHPPDTLRVGVCPSPPFIMPDGEGGYEGLSLELWSMVSEKANIYAKYIEFSDDIAIIRALDYGEIDLSINPLLNNPSRIKKFHVTQPIYISELGVAITTSSQSQFQIFLNNFFSVEFLEVILLLFLILLLFGTLLWLLERSQNKYQFRPGVLGMLDGLWWAAVTMTTVGYGDKAPKTTAGKTIAVVWMFTAVIIISSFTATIASTLTVNSLESNIRNLADLKTVDRIGVVGATEGQDFLVRHEMAGHEIYRTALQGLAALSRKEINVLVHDRLSMEYLINKNSMDNKVKLLSLGFESRYRCWMMPKSHPHFEEVNLFLMEGLESPSWIAALRKYSTE